MRIDFNKHATREYRYVFKPDGIEDTNTSNFYTLSSYSDFLFAMAELPKTVLDSWVLNKRDPDLNAETYSQYLKEMEHGW